MKRIAALLLGLGILIPGAFAQSSLRYNYSQNGICHISCDQERVDNGKDAPFLIRLEYLRFSEDSDGFLMHMNFQGKKPLDIPKGVKMTVTLTGNKTVRAEQIGENAPNVGRFLSQPYDILQMAEKGVRYLDLPTGWNPDDHVQFTFTDNELGQVVKRQYELICNALAACVPLEGEILGMSEGAVSTRFVAKPQVAKGANMIYNVGLTRLIYKDKDGEDFDLSLQLGTEKKYIIPYASDVLLQFGDGSSMTLKQHGDSVNRVVLYPTVSEIRTLKDRDIVSMTLQTDEKPLTETFKDGELSRIVNQLYQLLMSVNP